MDSMIEFARPDGGKTKVISPLPAKSGPASC